MGAIYKLTSPSGKSYIGQTRNSFDIRWKQHVRDANCNSVLPIHIAIRKYGPENFVNQILEEIPNEELNAKEQYYIQKYDTYNNGYNCTLGGEGNCKIMGRWVMFCRYSTRIKSVGAYYRKSNQNPLF